MEEIDEVLKVYVDKSESFMDVDNVRSNSVDIFRNTRKDVKKWEDSNFRKHIFQDATCGEIIPPLREKTPEKM